ncbi:MAG: hypothetical protein PHG02_04010 [Oscillospiraceae bacterium]|nr:hypothetical protein [Oscillospiraceae bacterium]
MENLYKAVCLVLAVTILMLVIHLFDGVHEKAKVYSSGTASTIFCIR